MKLLIVLCTLLVLATADWVPKTREEFIKDRDDCFKSENVSEENAEKLKNHIFPHDKASRCFVRCVGVKAGTWDDLEGYDAERFLKTSESNGFEVSLENLKRCFHHVLDTDTCTWATANTRCLWDNNYITKKQV